MANFSLGWNFGLPARLKFCCDYMANFIPRAMFQIGQEDVQENILHAFFCAQLKRCACPSSYFGPGWNLDAITWGFSARPEIQPGLKLFSCNRKRLFKTEISAWAEICYVIGPLGWKRDWVICELWSCKLRVASCRFSSSTVLFDCLLKIVNCCWESIVSYFVSF